jgi:hypothetical protein
MFSNMRLTPVGEAVARGVPTTKTRAGGDLEATQVADDALGTGDPASEPAAGGKILPPQARKPPGSGFGCHVKSRGWHDACLLSYTYANCANISSL